MYRRLRCFDFDNTIFRSPQNTPENKRLFEHATGIPWDLSKGDADRLSRQLKKEIHPRRGWWGRKESLLPPIVPDPVPADMWIGTVLDAMRDGLEEDTLTILLTGRHVGLKKEVLRILDQGGFESAYGQGVSLLNLGGRGPIHLHLLGMDGPHPDIVGEKPGDTFQWKIWILQQYRLELEHEATIEIWEDREEHVAGFREFGGGIQEELIVHHVVEDAIANSR